MSNGESQVRQENGGHSYLWRDSLPLVLQRLLLQLLLLLLLLQLLQLLLLLLLW